MKHLRTWIVGAALGLFGLGGWAFSQNANQVLLTMLGSELIQIYPSGNLTAATVYTTVSSLRDGRMYVQLAPTTGFTLTMTPLQSAVSLNPAGTLATGAIVLPPTTIDGKAVMLFASQTITALTLSTSNGATFTPAAITTLAANGSAEYIYSVAANTWYRIQ